MFSNISGVIVRIHYAVQYRARRPTTDASARNGIDSIKTFQRFFVKNYTKTVPIIRRQRLSRGPGDGGIKNGPGYPRASDTCSFLRRWNSFRNFNDEYHFHFAPA